MLDSLRMTPDELKALPPKVAALASKIDAAIAAAQKDLAGVDERWKAEHQADRRREIHAELVAKTDPLVNELRDAFDAIDAQAALYSPDAAKVRARFTPRAAGAYDSDERVRRDVEEAAIAMYWQQRCDRADLYELGVIAGEAARTKNAALGATVERALRARPEWTAFEMRATRQALASIPPPAEDRAALETLTATRRAIRLAAVALREARDGRAYLEDRVNASRDLGDPPYPSGSGELPLARLAALRERRENPDAAPPATEGDPASRISAARAARMARANANAAVAAPQPQGSTNETATATVA